MNNSGLGYPTGERGYFMSEQEERQAKAMLLLEHAETGQALELRLAEAKKWGNGLNSISQTLVNSPTGAIAILSRPNFSELFDVVKLKVLVTEIHELDGKKREQIKSLSAMGLKP